jgi:hypothetical protein
LGLIGILFVVLRSMRGDREWGSGKVGKWESGRVGEMKNN